MRVDLLSLFSSYFDSPLSVSMLRRATEKGVVEISTTDIRDFAAGKHRKVDDAPYGGGPGMVLMPGPVVQAIRSLRREASKVIYLCPQGKKLTQEMCWELSKLPHLILLAGHYEGIDERAIEKEVDERISIGDYILTNGCLASLVLLDAVVRLLPGVLGDQESAAQDSLEQGTLKGPIYTRPQEFEGSRVPEELLSGHHAKIRGWREDKRTRGRL